MLMSTTLSIVEEAYGSLQQEETQKKVLSQIKEENEPLAMFINRKEGGCKKCGKQNHTTDNC